jgi:hypothetical protein
MKLTPEQTKDLQNTLAKIQEEDTDAIIIMVHSSSKGRASFTTGSNGILAYLGMILDMDLKMMFSPPKIQIQMQPPKPEHHPVLPQN